MLGWRDVPVDEATRRGRRAAAPGHPPAVHRRRRRDAADQDAFERKLYVIRRVVERADRPEALRCPSFLAHDRLQGDADRRQLPRFYPDLRDARCKPALALVHSRFSTNTFPSWELAHPYRMIAHNGEINTLRGNVNWMRARESQLASELFGDDLAKVLPVVRPGDSDSATFDNVLELLMLGGPLDPARGDDDDPRGLPHREDLPETSRASTTSTPA